ncbi:MAG: ABC transporter ATP-binding protein [Polyangiaceae bacterium]|nr:ABC transporter ATP-binding protein [Polyangiaceae bacterium]
MPKPNGPIVECTQLRKLYGDGQAARAALDGVSLTVQPGEFVVILGQSGSGKSTLLGIIGGLERAYEGNVVLFGNNVASLSDKQLARLRGEKIGFVFQAFHLLQHLCVLDNVLAPTLFDTSSADKTDRALAVLDHLGLKDRANDFPSQLSGGQRQRVAIARALLQKPALLLCDEPTGNLDTETGDRTIALFRDLHREGLTLLAVTHEERLAAVATRVIHLKDGKIYTTNSTAPLRGGVAGAEPPPPEYTSTESAYTSSAKGYTSSPADEPALAKPTQVDP